MRKKNLAIKAITLVLPFILSSCSLLPVEEPVLPAPVYKPHEIKTYETFEAIRGDLISEKKLDAVLTPSESETFNFPFSDNRNVVFFVEEGQEVKKGDILAQYEAVNQINNLKNQQKNLKDAELQLAQLIERQAIKERSSAQNGSMDIDKQYLKEKEALELNITILNKNIQNAQDDIDEVTTFAGIDGVVTKQYNEFAIILGVTNSAEHFFEIKPPESNYLTEGEAVVISSGEMQLNAVVMTAEMMAEANLKDSSKYAVLTDHVELEATNNRFSIMVTLINERNILYVPYQSVKISREKNFIYILENEIKTARDVELGVYANGYYQILSGLSEGEIVVVK